MSAATDALQFLMLRELETFERELALFPDEAQIWATAPGVTNSVGNLVAHVCGNLQHFVGHVLGGTGYVRQRDLEFSRRGGTRAELVAELHIARDVLARVLPQLTADTLAAEYPIAVAGRRFTTELFLHQLAVHLAMHLGQAGYLRRILTGDATSTDPTPVKVLGRAE